MKKTSMIVVVLFVVSMLAACATQNAGTGLQQHHYEGGAAGAVAGAVAGAFIDKKNGWRGGVIGGALGALAGATFADISVRGSQEAARSGRPVEYRTNGGNSYYRAEPASNVYYPDEQTQCRKVHEKVWEGDRQVKDVVKEVCEGRQTRYSY